MSKPSTPLARARELFGNDLLGPEEVARALGAEPAQLYVTGRPVLSEVPYDMDTLRAAHGRGEFLVLRINADSSGPLTVLRLHELFPGAFRHKPMMEGVGYLLKDEWTLSREPFAASATCRLEWSLVHREPIAATRNLSFELQENALADYATSIGLAGRLRRRSAVEIVYDTLLFQRVRGIRLLQREWDWSDTPGADGGYFTAGEFTDAGLCVIAYSRAVRFGTLGICAQH